LPKEGKGGSPRGELVPQQSRKPERIVPQQTRVEDNPFALATAQDLFGKLSETPEGEDPAFWPVHVLNELNHHILNRDHPGNERPGLWGISSRQIGERFAPMQEHMQKVKTAYEILAYPHCKYAGRRENIEDELARDQQSFARDQVELSDDELQILRTLAAAKKLPVDPQKRIYQYAEVFHPSQNIEKALDGAEFMQWLAAQKREGKQGNEK
jgi:hypothetical protein